MRRTPLGEADIAFPNHSQRDAKPGSTQTPMWGFVTLHAPCDVDKGDIHRFPSDWKR